MARRIDALATLPTSGFPVPVPPLPPDIQAARAAPMMPMAPKVSMRQIQPGSTEPFKGQAPPHMPGYRESLHLRRKAPSSSHLHVGS